MNWYLKCAGFKALSALPGGGRLYAFAQAHITKTTQPTRQRVEQKVNVGLQYWHWLHAHGFADRLRRGTLLDFGAGWHPTIPLLFYSLGVPRQILLDVMPLMDVPRVAETRRIFCELVADSANSWRSELVRLPSMVGTGNSTLTEMLEPLGCSYYAPYAKTFTPVPGSVDLLLCTQVLQHLSREGQLEVFRWWHQLLKPGGVFMTTIHLVGHFGNTHLSTGRYKHLTISPWVWEKLLNSSLMYYNRLKGPDYRETIQQAGFRLREFVAEPPTPEGIEGFARTRVHPCFNRYSREDLMAKHLFIVAEKV